MNTNLIIFIIQLIFIPLVSPLIIGIVRKIKAKFQNREGASIFQPFIDLKKLFQKDEIISRDASWIFRYSPYLIFAVSLVLGINIPIFTTIFHPQFGDLLLVVYLIALSTFFLALSGIDVGSAFGGFGSSREMTISALTEGGFLFSLITIAMITHSTNLFMIADSVNPLLFNNFAPIVLSFLGFIIVMLAETARFPFDNPSTHLELTMIHEAMILEYSGKRLALIEWASANKFVLFLLMAANLFIPWGILTTFTISGLIFSLLVAFLKITLIAVFVAVLESSIAKFRFFRLPDLLFTSFILSIIAINLIN